MNSCRMEQNAMGVVCESRRESLVCPRPRRIPVGDNFRPIRWHPNNHSDMSDLRAGAELLDIILSKGSGVERPANHQIASSPPFFCGSPPSRVSNPVVHDEHFGSGNLNPFSSNAPTLPSSPSSTAARCARVKFGQKPVPVRIEGFDCLGRDRQNCSISAVA